jgi:hypothetical protein
MPFLSSGNSTLQVRYVLLQAYPGIVLKILEYRIGCPGNDFRNYGM